MADDRSEEGGFSNGARPLKPASRRMALPFFAPELMGATSDGARPLEPASRRMALSFSAPELKGATDGTEGSLPWSNIDTDPTTWLTTPIYDPRIAKKQDTPQDGHQDAIVLAHPASAPARSVLPPSCASSPAQSSQGDQAGAKRTNMLVIPRSAAVVSSKKDPTAARPGENKKATRLGGKSNAVKSATSIKASEPTSQKPLPRALKKASPASIGMKPPKPTPSVTKRPTAAPASTATSKGAPQKPAAATAKAHVPMSRVKSTPISSAKSAANGSAKPGPLTGSAKVPPSSHLARVTTPSTGTPMIPAPPRSASKSAPSEAKKAAALSARSPSLVKVAPSPAARAVTSGPALSAQLQKPAYSVRTPPPRR